MPADGAEPPELALQALLAHLYAHDYDFVMPGRSTHARGRDRRAGQANTALTDLFGWGRPLALPDLDPETARLAQAAQMLESVGSGQVRSTRAVSRLGGLLHLHSMPGTQDDAVFLGPDTYRFLRWVDDMLDVAGDVRTVCDIGTGSGAGALRLSSRFPQALVLGVDLNPAALTLAQANAAAAGRCVRFRTSDGLSEVGEPLDRVIMNPPFIADPEARLYRDGGALLGAERAVEWVGQAVSRLTDRGQIILYSGAPIVEGSDLLRDALADQAARSGLDLVYEELDPDIFPGTLRGAAYGTVDRLAAVGAVLARR